MLSSPSNLKLFCALTEVSVSTFVSGICYSFTWLHEWGLTVYVGISQQANKK